MSDLRPDELDVLRHAREWATPTATERSRVRQQLLTKLAGSATIVGGQAAASRSSIASLLKLLAGIRLSLIRGKAVFAAVLLAGAAALGAIEVVPTLTNPAARREARVATTSAIVNPPEALHGTRLPTTMPEPLPVVSPTPGNAAAPSPKMAGPEHQPFTASSPALASAVPMTSSQLEGETRLFEAGLAALRRGSAADALYLFDQHAAQFPLGALAEERTVERILALCALGRAAEATGEADRFVRDHSRSPLAAKLHGVCGYP
jgi:hypothetical protein